MNEERADIDFLFSVCYQNCACFLQLTAQALCRAHACLSMLLISELKKCQLCDQQWQPIHGGTGQQSGDGALGRSQVQVNGCLHTLSHSPPSVPSGGRWSSRHVPNQASPTTSSLELVCFCFDHSAQCLPAGSPCFSILPITTHNSVI